MLCDVCKKNEAKVHLTQIIENKMQTVDLCEPCSKAKGVDDPTGFSLASILVGLGTPVKDKETTEPTATGELTCPRCGFSQADFKKSGRMGCTECYTTFAEPLQALLKSMHKGTQHTGKVPRPQPKAAAPSEKLEVLQTKLDLAIKEERYEEAALLRDRIKQGRPQVNPPR